MFAMGFMVLPVPGVPMRRLLLALALAAPSLAQGPVPDAAVVDTELVLDMAPANATVRPLGPFVTFAIQVHYRYLEAFPEPESTPITLSVASAPPWAVATVSPTTVFVAAALPPCGCERDAVGEAFLLVTTTQDAPAFEPAGVVVVAEAPEHGAYKAARGERSAEVAASYFGLVEATTPAATQKIAVGQRAEFPVTVTNFGNGASRAVFGLEPAPPPGLLFVLPPPGLLGARQQGSAANTATFPVRVEATGPFETTTLNITVTAGSVQDPSAEGDATKVTVRVQPPGAGGPGGVTRGAPGPEAALLAVALGALAWARRSGDDV